MTDSVGDEAAGLSFEQALSRLERIVQRLEAGDVSLEESIDLYTEGTRLKQHCEAKLASAQARIERLQLGPDGQPTGVTPLDPD